jgi:hypothetical protein|tara:strand:+ start:3479 stop:4045 length:567 start_codon:yes stop_codon:yes gene_type:complete
MEIKLENWFSTKIFHTNIDIEFCNKLQEKVVIDKDNWKRDLNNVNALTTGWDGLNQYQDLQELSQYICQNVLPKIGQSQNWRYNNWHTKEAWVNFYQKGDSTKMHNHGFADFCGVLIIKPGEGNLIFSRTELIEGKTKPFETINDEQINETKGKLVLFPSYLYHTVTDCKNDRISVAFNFSNDPIKEL